MRDLRQLLALRVSDIPYLEKPLVCLDSAAEHCIE